MNPKDLTDRIKFLLGSQMVELEGRGATIAQLQEEIQALKAAASKEKPAPTLSVVSAAELS